MVNNQKSFTSSSATTPQKSTTLRKSTSRLIGNQLNETNSKVIVRPITHVIYRNESSLITMTNEANRNVYTVSHPSKVVRKKKKKTCFNKSNNNKTKTNQ